MSKKDTVLGDRLKELRGKKDINQEHVALDLGISRARYSHYENNHVEPDTEMIRKLARYYNVTTDYLLGHHQDDQTFVGQNIDNNEEVDTELQEFIDKVRVWYQNEPKDKEQKLKVFRRMFEAFKGD